MARKIEIPLQITRNNPFVDPLKSLSEYRCALVVEHPELHDEADVRFSNLWASHKGIELD
jgi:hypothetical protein